jgi:type II secretory pathway component PulJ
VTIVELLIASTIFMIVILVAFDALDTVSKSSAYQANRTQTLDDMRGALNRLTRDLRQASSVDEAASTPSTITFTTYINGALTPIVYVASGTTLTRQVGSAAPFPVLENLADTDVFGYVSAGSGVQWVDMTLSVTPTGYPSTTLVLESEVNLRNRTTALTGAP